MFAIIYKSSYSSPVLSELSLLSLNVIHLSQSEQKLHKPVLMSGVTLDFPLGVVKYLALIKRFQVQFYLGGFQVSEISKAYV